MHELRPIEKSTAQGIYGEIVSTFDVSFRVRHLVKRTEHNLAYTWRRRRRDRLVDLLVAIRLVDYMLGCLFDALPLLKPLNP